MFDETFKTVFVRFVGLDSTDLDIVHVFLEKMGLQPVSININKNNSCTGQYVYKLKQRNLYDFNIKHGGESERGGKC